jgi:electron transport complex protein RnfD
VSTAPLLVTASPHLKAPDSTPKIMWHVVLSLLPIWGVSIYYFGPSSFLVVLAATLGCLLPERLFGKRGSLGDGSCVITGMLLGLTLPPGTPLWMAFLGGVFGIGFGKLVFGGLGQNPFNPALIGRAFLQASFPVALTTWPAANTNWWSFYPSTFAWPLMSAPDVKTEPTPLGIMKWPEDQPPLPEFTDMLFGSTGGSLGETAGVLILICGGYLALRNYLNWRIPVSIFLTVGAFTGLLYLVDSEAFAAPHHMLFSGGLMLGAVYMATDMVTSPTTHRGAWIFGFGIGFLVVVIRVWGGLPEGVQYAILLMNALVPFLNRWTQPRVFGTGKAKPEAAS